MRIADAITADLAARRPRVDITHPRAGAWRVTYRLPVDSTEFDPQRQAALDATKTERAFMFEAAALAVVCEGIAYQGQALTQADGAPATFRSQEVIDELGATSASDAVRKLYGSDGVVQAVFVRLEAEAGYRSAGEVIVDSDEPDPTNAGTPAA